jgi:hypothetical protein
MRPLRLALLIAALLAFGLARRQWVPSRPPALAGAWRQEDGESVWVLQQDGALVVSGAGSPLVGTWTFAGGELRCTVSTEGGAEGTLSIRPRFLGPERTGPTSDASEVGTRMTLAWGAGGDPHAGSVTLKKVGE